MNDGKAAQTLQRLLEDPACLDDIPIEAIPAALSSLSAVSMALSSRLLHGSAQNGRNGPPDDSFLDAAEASKEFKLSKSFLYRTKSLPFRFRAGKRVLFSRQGFEKWVKARQGR